MKSISEEFCKDRFDRFLRGLFPNSTISWEEVPPISEPPEFYLSVDGTKYAVEVTILMQKAIVGARKPLPVETIRDLLRRFVTDEVQSVARKQQYLHGVYLVTFSKPIDNLTNVKAAIQNELLSYIRTTEGLNKAPLKVVHKCGRQKCQIEKIRGGEGRVVMGGPAMSGWEGEAIVVVRQLLERSIGQKEHKLRNISSPKVLLLHDKYPFADVADYRACILSISPLMSFHTVFLVGNAGEDLVLYSQDPSWCPDRVA